MARPGGMSDEEDDDYFMMMGDDDDDSDYYEEPSSRDHVPEPEEDVEFHKFLKLAQGDSETSDANPNRDLNANQKFGIVPPFEAFRQAVSWGDVEVTERMMTTLEIEVDQALKHQWTALLHASYSGQPEMVKFLIEKGADPNYHAEEFTPLMAVCKSSQDSEESLLRCMEILIEHGAVVDDQSFPGVCNTPLMVACSMNKPSLVKKLIDSGADVRKQDDEGFTASHYAKEHKDAKCVQYFTGLSTETESIDEESNAIPKLIVDTSEETEEKEEESELCPELSQVLGSLHLLEYEAVFRKHKVNLLQFLTMRDKDFDQLGITDRNARRTLREAIKEIHMQPYNKESMPVFSKDHQLTPSDIMEVMRNLSFQVTNLRSSLQFVIDQVKQNPEGITCENEYVAASRLKDVCQESFGKCEDLKYDLKDMQALINMLVENPNYEPADLVKEKDARCSYIPTSIIAAVSAVAFAAVIATKYGSLMKCLPFGIK